MARKKMEAAMEEMSKEPEAVKAEENSPEEESTEEPEAVKAEENPPEEEPTEEFEAVKAEENPPEEKPLEDSAPELAGYKIVCRNKITKRIGGVDFKDGAGYTDDGYAASWFAAKDGYTVKLTE